jgi:sulfate transport system permease protein
MATLRRRVLPGFSLTLGYAVFYLSLLVLIPLGACVLQASSLGWEAFLAAAWTDQAIAAYKLTFGAAFIAAAFNAAFGLVVAWVLVRYEFPGKRIFDAAVDLPLALPTAAAGLVFGSLYTANGWLGQFLVPLGIEGAHSRLGIVLVLTFTGFPFVVRTVQPVLEDLDPELEEAAATMGASRLQTFTRILLPTILPALLTGFALAFARGVGEYGSVVFISSNIPFETEIAPTLILAQLNQSKYPAAAAIAVVLLSFSLLTLVAINFLERWSKRYDARD